METYNFLRAFADSWVLLAMMVFFMGVVVWAFRPGSRPVHDEAATSIFRNETRPARDAAEAKSGPQSKEAWK
jgi:cytochrome c oxidase cbb3-type subunit 4